MKNQEYLIYTKLTEQIIIDKIKNVIHLKKNFFIKNMMFKKIIREDNGKLNFVPNFGPINFMIIVWKYVISFNDLDKGFIRVKVESKFNFLSLVPIILMLIFITIILIPFFRDNNLRNFGYITIVVFSLFFIINFAISYFSIKSYKKNIINLLTTLIEGEIEYLK